MANAEHTTPTVDKAAWEAALQLESITIDAGLFAQALHHMVETAFVVNPAIFSWVGSQVDALADRIEQQRLCLAEAVVAGRQNERAAA